MSLKIEITKEGAIEQTKFFAKKLFWYSVVDVVIIMLLVYLLRNESAIDLLGKAALILILLVILRDLYKNNFHSPDKFRNKVALRKEFRGKVSNQVYKTIISSPGSSILRNRHEVVTVMFMDLRGFTSLSEKISPQSAFTLINNYLSRMSEVIVNYEGTIDKYIGDAIMAFWNAPVRVDDHPHKALKCALQLKEEVDKFSKEIGTNMEVGIGLHTGLVSVGNVGNRYNSDYTIIGDNVNLTSRLEGLTKKYKIPILVSESIYKSSNQSANDILFREIDDVIVKGRSKAVKIYEPLHYSDKNAELKDLYENALTLSRAGMYIEAIRALKKSDDLPSKVLLERVIPMYKSHQKWNGIWSWDSK